MSTLRSVQLADLLVHVVDAASENAEEQIAAVHEVLGTIGADHVPELLVFNKADVPGSRARDLANLYPGSVFVSALTGENLDAVITAIGERLRIEDRTITVRFPLDRGDLVAAAHREGDVLETTVEENAMVLRIALDPVGAARFGEWRVAP